MADVIYGCRLLVVTKLDPDTGLPTGDNYNIGDAIADPDNQGTGSATSGGSYTGEAAGIYEVMITKANSVQQTITDAEFIWRFAGGAWSDPIVVDGTAQDLGTDGVTIQFAAGASGQDFEEGDTWKIEVTTASVNFETPQQANVTPQFSEGQSTELRGGDKLLAVVEDDAKLTGLDITFTDAELPGAALALLAGGSWDNVTNTYEAPKVADAVHAPVKAELYVAKYEESAQDVADVAGYRKWIFPWVKGRVPTWNAQDRNFLVPQYTLRCRENNKAGLPCFRFEDVDSLPA